MATIGTVTWLFLGATHPALDGTTTVVVATSIDPPRAQKTHVWAATHNGVCIPLGKSGQPYERVAVGHWPMNSSQFRRLSACRRAPKYYIRQIRGCQWPRHTRLSYFLTGGCARARVRGSAPHSPHRQGLLCGCSVISTRHVRFNERALVAASASGRTLFTGRRVCVADDCHCAIAYRLTPELC